MSLLHRTSSSTNEGRATLALQALKNNASLTVRRAALLYNVSRTSLNRRRAGIASRRDIPPNSRKFSELEELAIVRHILDLVSRGFPPRLIAVRQMADSLLAVRGAGKVGENWPSTFVHRSPELRTQSFRKYDHQRAKCEDPEVIGNWFKLVHDMKAKYGIVDEDIYNFDETGF